MVSAFKVKVSHTSSGLHAHHEGLHKAGIRIGRRIRAPEATLATKMRKHHDIELARLDLPLTIPTHVRLMACVVGAMRTLWRTDERKHRQDGWDGMDEMKGW